MSKFFARFLGVFVLTFDWDMKQKSVGEGGGGTPLYGLYGDVLLDRVSVLAHLP